MASESIGLDDIMATMLSMGFEVQDCQDAITNGKLTAQAAIDWILAGKPGNVQSAPAPSLNLSAGPSLPLGNQSNPFVPSETASSQAGSPSPMETEEQIVSRSHLSDKQLQIKQNFEEKERIEARKKVTEEKMKKKLEKERILKEIQEDREKQKLTRSSGGRSQAQATTAPPVSPSQSAVAKSPAPTGSSVQTSNIQVRLPSGEMFRESFPSSATLNTVWDSVYNKIKSAINGYSGFIQPFPRKEYSKEEMGQSLSELGLVPSGSLVLKKKDAQQASQTEGQVGQPPPGPEVAAGGEDEEAEPMEEGHGWGPGHRVEEEGQAGGQGQGHGWGQGHRVQAEEGGMEEAAAGIQNVENEGVDALNQIPGLNNNPIVGGNYGGWGPAAQDQGHAFEGFGNRLIPEGVPGDHGAHRNRTAAEMAAAAAAQRFALPPAAPAPAAPTAELLYQVNTLQHSSMTLLAHALTDPRQPIFSISGLPEELLQSFLTFLKKEKLLKPKILHMIPSYLLKLDLDYYPYATNELLHSARIFVNLHVLSVCSSQLITDTALNSIKGMKALKVLNLSGCTNLTDACFLVLKDCQNLQSLCLEGTHVTDSGVSQFCSVVATPQLSHLDLSRTAVTHAIFKHLKNLKLLKTLLLKQSWITSLSGVESITELSNLDVSETEIVTDSILCLTRHPRLSNISLSGTLHVNGDQALSYLKDMSLTSLVLPQRSTTTDLGMSYISGFHLSQLDLTNYTNITDEGIAHVGRLIGLKKLLLSNTKLTDEGMKHLTNLVQLQVFNADRTYVTSAGAMLVVNFKNLNELSLSQTSITDEFLQSKVLNQCIHLTKLNLSRTQLSNSGVGQLCVPHLVMVNLENTLVQPHMLSTIQTNCPQARAVSLPQG